MRTLGATGERERRIAPAGSQALGIGDRDQAGSARMRGDTLLRRRVGRLAKVIGPRWQVLK
jgi:hypothetical protein